MTHRVTVNKDTPRQGNLFPATGGTTGGEEETSSKSHLTLALYHWPRGLPGPPPEEVFWGYWLNDAVIPAEEERNAEDPRLSDSHEWGSDDSTQGARGRPWRFNAKK